ncbi:MAG: hypothetical protein EOO68_28550, partial [Moraxellaceae bacterium]
MSDWNHFLTSQGALMLDDGKLDFPHPELSPDSNYVMPLHQGLIEIKGPDSTKFLQGQVTCDVRELAEKTTILGAQCNIEDDWQSHSCGANVALGNDSIGKGVDVSGYDHINVE